MLSDPDAMHLAVETLQRSFSEYRNTRNTKQVGSKMNSYGGLSHIIFSMGF